MRSARIKSGHVRLEMFDGNQFLPSYFVQLVFANEVEAMVSQIQPSQADISKQKKHAPYLELRRCRPNAVSESGKLVER